MLLNTGNYFFNKNMYINCIKNENNLIDSYAADVYYLIFLWFKYNKLSRLKVVKNMKYIHRLHNNMELEEGSHYVKNSYNSEKVVNEINKLITQL